jgi:hypothetical protein
MSKKKDRAIVEQITRIRARNNGLWMGLLELALETSPRRAKLILQAINHNDREISLLLGGLAESSGRSPRSGRSAGKKK